MPTAQSNILTLHEIHTRPELWKDKIYYLERNPYWNTSYDFFPTPTRYATIIQEFHQELTSGRNRFIICLNYDCYEENVNLFTK